MGRGEEGKRGRGEEGGGRTGRGTLRDGEVSRTLLGRDGCCFAQR